VHWLLRLFPSLRSELLQAHEARIQAESLLRDAAASLESLRADYQDLAAKYAQLAEQHVEMHKRVADFFATAATGRGLFSDTRLGEAPGGGVRHSHIVTGRDVVADAVKKFREDLKGLAHG
jgi:hypothetical protein